jgi:integrase
VDRVHLFQRGEAWWVYYLLDGRRVRKSLKTDNKKIAEGIRAELEVKLRHSELRHEQPLPPAEFIERFHEYQRPRKTKKSHATDRVYLDRLIEAVPVRDLRELTGARISEYLTLRANKDKLAPKTLNRIRQVVGTFFEWLIDQELLRDNPIRRVKRFPEPAPIIRYLKHEQIDELLRVVRDDRVYSLVATLVFAGLRRSEALWLRWEDIDLERNLLSVRAKRDDDERWQPKTKRNRLVPIQSRLAAILRELPKTSGWVFTSPKGCRWDPDNLSQRYTALVRAAGLPWSLLDLRHTFGTMLAMKGKSLAKIAAVMGNSPEICRRHYAHIATEDLHVDVEF